MLLWLLYSTTVLSVDFDCKNAADTIQIDYCAGVKLKNAENEMNTYLLKSKEHNNHDPELIKSIKIAQRAWSVYAKAHCDSIYTKWREYTKRGLVSLSCKRELTEQRTHDIWSNFLKYRDSTPPILPEPKAMKYW